MKKSFLVFVLCLSFGWMPNSQARISRDIFNAETTLTVGKLFLNQVDTVSLYLSTERLVYEPRLTKEMQLTVSMTLLDPSLSNREAIKNLVLRHIRTFNKTLMERLEFYTPKLAKNFDPNQDCEFVVQIGSDRKMVATWKEGVWNWVGGIPVSKPEVKESPKRVQSEPVSTVEAVEQEPAFKKKCPALISGSKAPSP